MNAGLEGNGRRRRGVGGGATFNISNIIGDPFALITISVATLAWLISLIASIVSEIKSTFPNFAWWTIAYMLCCIVGVTIVIGSNSHEIYQVAIVGFLAAGLVFTTSAVNTLVYSTRPEQEASAAGFILMSMVAIVWIFYFGSNREASPRGYIDQFALHKEQRGSVRNSRPMGTNDFGRPETTVSGNQPPQMYTSAQLNGFETSSPVSGYPGGPVGGGGANSQPRFLGQQGSNSPARTPTTAVAPGGLGGEPAAVNDVGAPTEYPYRAKAIYSYEANPDDANEISFSKHEILEVSDVSGRWWQAKKETGETGIAPSNYLILL